MKVRVLLTLCLVAAIGALNACTAVINSNHQSPIASDYEFSTAPDSNFAFSLSDYVTAEGDIAFEITKNPEHGALTGTPPTLEYKSIVGFEGEDRIEFKVIVGDKSATATIKFHVKICTAERVLNSPYAAGDGTSTNPYIICSGTQMHTIGSRSSDWDKYFLLGQNISLLSYTGNSFNTIGNYSAPFTGSFSGNDKNISDFNYVNNSGSGPGDYRGLFGVIEEATIEDLSIVDSSLTAYENIGILIGEARSNSTISNCHVNNSSILGGQATALLVGSLIGNSLVESSTVLNSTLFATDEATGGLVGRMQQSTVMNSFAAVATSGSNANYQGGLVGQAYGNSTITHSYASGNVTCDAETCGGLVGSIDGIIENSYATGNVTGDRYCGGLAGFIGPTSEIRNTFARGNVIAPTDSGGLVGECAGLISNSYSVGQVSDSGKGFVGFSNTCSGNGRNYFDSDTSNADSDEIASPRPTLQMKLLFGSGTPAENFSYITWDTSIWNLISGQYPTLK